MVVSLLGVSFWVLSVTMTNCDFRLFWARAVNEDGGVTALMSWTIVCIVWMSQDDLLMKCLAFIWGNNSLKMIQSQCMILQQKLCNNKSGSIIIWWRVSPLDDEE